MNSVKIKQEAVLWSKFFVGQPRQINKGGRACAKKFN